MRAGRGAATLLLLTLTVPAHPQGAPDPHAHHHPPPATSERYARSLADYAPPDVPLVDQQGRKVSLASVLGHDGPVLLQFIFTTCPTICPVMSAGFSAAQERLGADLERVRMVSISIDPEHDTPERLREYAARWRAGERWVFLTGKLDHVVAVQKAFEAYRGNKMRHEPVTFLRPAPGSRWVRLDGLPGGEDLAEEVRRAAPSPALGRRIYRDGVLPSGEPLRAALHGAELSGAAVACASCHRRSGFGTSEGAYVPPIAGPYLFEGRQPSRADLFHELYQKVQTDVARAHLRDPQPRPPYTGETLGAALRDGRDPTGRELDPLMPRYRLGEEDLAHLAAYLRTLAAEPAPGVDEREIHFATVIAPGADPGERAALLAVMEAYVRRKNGETRALLERPGHSPWHRDDFADSWREWVLHAWELEGPPEGWRAQLEAKYRERPVFAVLGGLSGRSGDWRPVHGFCEENAVPCLFPETDLPVLAPEGDYALYLSKGIALEGAGLARHFLDFSEELGIGDGDRILQVHRGDERGRAAARAFREGLGEGRFLVTDRALGRDEADWARLLKEERPAVLVLWLGPEDWAALAEAGPALEGIRRIALAGGFLGKIPPVPPALRERALLTWRWSLPGHEDPRIYRVRGWLRSRGIERTHERLQLNAHFTLTVADHALGHLVESYSRDFFVENVEEETENALSPGVYPHLSLGPGQRFASKGCWVLRFAEGEGGGGEWVGEWVVP